jgi:hypothetical protein
LDTGLEFSRIVEAAKNANKKFTLRKVVANFENLNEVMGCRPKMIHISCHGDSFINNNLNPPRYQFFLAFEDAHRLCVLDKFDEDRLKELLGIENSQVLVVFVSACHSEIIG